MFELASDLFGETPEDVWASQPFEFDIFNIQSEIVELKERLESFDGVIDPKVYESISEDLSYNSARLDFLYSEYQAGRLSTESIEDAIREVQFAMDRIEQRINMYDSSRG